MSRKRILMQTRLSRCIRREMKLYAKEGIEVKSGSSIFWNAIFARFFGTIARGSTDSRWDLLLHDLHGLRLLAQHLGKERYW